MSEEQKTSTTEETKAESTEAAESAESTESTTASEESNEAPNWLEKPGRVNQIYWSLWIVCGLLVVADLFYHKHTHFDMEKWFGLYGFYGFVACVSLVVAAKQMRKVLMREEDYYDR